LKENFFHDIIYSSKGRINMEGGTSGMRRKRVMRMGSEWFAGMMVFLCLISFVAPFGMYRFLLKD